jgi:hypothetical protein
MVRAHNASTFLSTVTRIREVLNQTYERGEIQRFLRTVCDMETFSVARSRAREA